VATKDDRIARLRDRLLPKPLGAAQHSLKAEDWQPPIIFDTPPRDAAVLIALVPRDGSYDVIYTQRAPDMRTHSGQISFPGGKIDAEDISPAAAALREAREEIALIEDEAEILGYLPHYLSGSNFLITPVVAIVAPSSPFVPNPVEVDSVFEVPLGLLAAEKSYLPHPMERRGSRQVSWKIDHGGRVIWGITGNLTRQFKEFALKDDENW